MLFNNTKKSCLKLLYLILLFSSYVYDIFADEYSSDPYSYKLENKMHKLIGKKPPYAALFSSSKTEILYLAVLHTTDAKSKTFDWIHTAIQNFKPDLVIFEGFESSRGYSSKLLIKEIEKNNPNSYAETFHAVYLSYNNNIPYLGGEVNDKVIINELKKEGYSIDDIVFFYFSRHIPQFYRQKQITKESDIVIKWRNYGNYLIKGYDVDFDKYKAWVKKHFGKYDFKLLINSENTAPISNGTFLQKIASKIGIIRDSHIIELIFENSKKFNKILVCYGASHLPTQYRALKNKYGKPKFLKHPKSLIK